jgi:hypothetical protein
MKRIALTFVLFLGAAIIATTLTPSKPHAQSSGAMIVATCGTVPVSYTHVGAVLPLTMNTLGKLC